MTRRNLELVLLCIAAPVVLILFAMMALNDGQELTLVTLGVPAGLFAAFLIAHITTRFFAPGADPAILPVVFALSGIGIAFVERLAPDLAVNQIMWLFLSVFCMIIVLAVSRNMDKLSNYKYTLMIFGFALLLSPLLPVVGQEIYGSRIWLSIAGFSFQPGELAKVIIVLFLAAYLSSNREMLSVFTVHLGPFRLPDIRTLLPMLLMWIIALLIVFYEKDLGSAVVFFFVFLMMLYVATGKRFYLIIGLLLMIAGCVAAYMLFTHVQVRVANWIDPFQDPQGTGYQMVQALFSMADGDLFGVGIGRGLCYLIPIVESDFIFAAIAEETGLLGAAGVLLLFLSFAIRGYVTAARAKSDYSSFVAAGITTTIVLQAFIIVGGVTKLIPLTGITLPFISQGGSSLLASFIGVGLLLRCGDEGTGVSEEMTNTFAAVHSNSVLGRVALGKRLTTGIVLLSLLFVALVANLTVIMVIQAKDYQNMTGNNHTIIKEAAVKRGTVLTADGVVLAQSVDSGDGYYTREYPAGDLASHVIGYYSTKYGTSGIEATYNSALTGEQNYASWIDVLNQQAGITTPGNDITLTIDSTIQQAAQDALSGYSGAVIVIDPRTGATLAVASSPGYNASDFEAILDAAATDPTSSVLLNRATQAQYPPGSTFKMVTLAVALDNNVASEDTVYEAPGVIEIGNAPVTNYGKEDMGYLTLEQATIYSSNTVFGQLGVEIGAQLLVHGADQFGFDNKLEYELPTAISVMANPDSMSVWETAWAAAGQPVGMSATTGPFTTVLQMALVGCAIANDGEIMKPYLVEGIYNANGERSYAATPTVLRQAISASTAQRELEILKGVVSYGTGTNAALYDVTVAGKTGTAETGKALDDSWFVGMAPADDPTVVVAIVLEEAVDDEWDENAAARARNVFYTALQIQGIL